MKEVSFVQHEKSKMFILNCLTKNIKNLQNNIDLDTDLTIIDTNAGGGGTGETDSLLAIEASSRVKLMVSKFDNKTVVVE